MTEDKVHNPWILLTDYCQQKKISRNTCYKWIKKGDLHKKVERGRAYVCNASSIIDVEFTPVTGDSQSNKEDNLSKAVSRMSHAADILTNYMQQNTEKILKLAEENGKLQARIEYQQEIINQMADRLNPTELQELEEKNDENFEGSAFSDYVNSLKK